MGELSKNVAKLYALKIAQGQLKISDVPAAYKTYVEIYMDQTRKGDKK